MSEPEQDDSIRRILSDYTRIAIVGLSENESRASNRVAQYLLQQGFTVIPVNPNYETLIGVPCYPSLSDIPDKVDIVDLFQRAERVPPFVDEAIEIGAKVVWMQLDIVHEEAAAKARAAGLEVVMDKCPKIEHQRLSL